MPCCNNRIVFVVVVCLTVGAVVGCFARILLDSPDAESMPETPIAVASDTVRIAVPAAAGERAECRKLKEKAERLERKLEGLVKRRERTQGESDLVPNHVMRANCKTYGEWRKRYPKLYGKMRKNFSKIATRRLENYEKWRQFLSSVDVSLLPENERRAHVELMETYARVHELLKENLESMVDDERTLAQDDANAKEIARLEEKGREMMANERNILMGAVAENLGRRLGWQGEDIAAFAETLRAIADVTAKDAQR